MNKIQRNKTNDEIAVKVKSISFLALPLIDYSCIP